MKNIIYITLFLGYFQSYSQYNQKNPIDTSTLDAWPILKSNAKISGDGNYVAYSVAIKKGAISQNLIVRSTSGDWEKCFVGDISEFYFSKDSRKLFYKNEDSICLIELGTGKILFFETVNLLNYSVYDKGEWIGYQLKASPHELVLLNLVTNRKVFLGTVKNFSFDNFGKRMLYLSEEEQKITKLRWIDLETEAVFTIWTSIPGQQASRFLFDRTGLQMSFLVSEKNENIISNTIWVFKQGMDKAEVRVTDQSPGIPQGLHITGNSGFSGNGARLIFTLTKKDSIEPKVDEKNAGVNIWSYQDKILYPSQKGGKSSFFGVMSVEGGTVVCPERENDWIDATFYTSVPGDYVVYRNDSVMQPNDYKETWWLVSLKDGTRKLLRGSGRTPFSTYFSPDGQWLVCWDSKKKAYLSFNVLTNRIFNLTSEIRTDFTSEYPSGIYPEKVSDIAGWTVDNKVLLYDRYDLWCVDLSNNAVPINLTCGYGKKNRLKLRLVYEKDEAGEYKQFHAEDLLLLTGFSEETKYNGFYSMRLGKPSSPKILTSGPYTWYRVRSQKPHNYAFSNGMQPIQAKESSAWILKRESATEYPNFYFTRDFKTFTTITNFQPQQNYLWLTTELIKYKLPNGKQCQGILYKPENFDSHKKYPVIFNYYEQLSHRIYEFPYPSLTRDNINIPWFVSRGYLVITPDIHYTVASSVNGVLPGIAALNSIESAAKFISKRSYIMKNRMGLQGHSFGGVETAYLLTHSKLFAAACEMAGVTDYVSFYLTLSGYPEETLNMQEFPQLRMGATLWEKPDLYIKSSAIMSANRITAPLLIVHNKKDGSVNFRQGLEFYMALRRLGKTCWLLQYDESGHLILGKEAVDYTIRLTQFFDHYLLGMPAPEWMTKNMQASLKKRQTGYEFDTKRMCSKDCKICQFIINGPRDGN